MICSGRREYDVKANVRPVYPIAVRIDSFFKNVHPLWWAYLGRDVARTAQMLSMLGRHAGVRKPSQERS
jgi:hypothetical protein